MESLTQCDILELPKDALLEVRKEYDLDKPGRMDEAVTVFEEWVKKQRHFVKKDFDKDYLERLIIAAKGSLETAKMRLDKLCRWRTINPHFFIDVDIEEHFSYIFNNFDYVITPKMTEKYERVYLCRCSGSGFTSSMAMDGYILNVMMAEYTQVHDYVKGYHIVIDYRPANMTDLIANTNLINLRDAALLMIDGYGVRVKGVHLITESKWMDTLVTLSKQVVSAKIRDRIFVHKNLESLHKVIPKDVFPEDYGGKEKPFAEMRADWVKVLNMEKNREYWRKMCAAKTDESLRLTDKFSDHQMGLPGSFRTLSVD